MKTKVLIMASYYIPSVKAGGPVQSIKNLVSNLSDRIEFYIITSDRDLGDKKPFDNIKSDKWSQIDNVNVYYTDLSELSFRKTVRILNSIKYDVLYLNSFFSFKYSIAPLLLRKINRIRNTPVVLAPRGEFSDGALGLKSFKKHLFITLSKIGKLYSDIHWHSTNDIEKLNIQRIFGEDIRVKIAGNLTANYNKINFSKDIIKQPGELKIVYISRIHPMKNLRQALEILKNINVGKIEFNIYGPIEDEQYWEICESEINEMPSNIKVIFNGLIPNEKIHEIHKQNHIFLLLTLGENFGHAISEAFIGGSPVVISNKTPWINLESKNVGWDLPLENNSLIANKISYFIRLDNNKYMEMAKKSFEYGKSKSNQREDIDSYIELLCK